MTAPLSHSMTDGLLRQSKGVASPSRRKRWSFRVAAILLGLSVFVVAELVCVALDLGREADDDPFVGFSNIYPLFVRDEGAPNYHIAKSRLRFFAPDEF